MAKLVTIWWRDIPSQVTVKKGRKNGKVLLSERFQEAIDRAAMRAGKKTTDEYLEDWRREEREVEGELQAIADAEAAALEARYSDDDLKQLERQHGHAQTADN
ncbi:MAG: virulence factor [Pseudomonadota bacterium]